MQWENNGQRWGRDLQNCSAMMGTVLGAGSVLWGGMWAVGCTRGIAFTAPSAAAAFCPGQQLCPQQGAAWGGGAAVGSKGWKAGGRCVTTRRDKISSISGQKESFACCVHPKLPTSLVGIRG